MKKVLNTGCKIISFVLVFCLIFAGLQAVLIPKLDNSVVMGSALYELEENSIDVLFLGSSQMYCTVDAQKLTENYGIKAFDFGAASQCLTSTYYYLQEALKVQNPKVVMVEVGSFFEKNSEITDRTFAFTYVPMKLTIEKLKSMYTILDGDAKKVLKFAFPLFEYHTRWNIAESEDITYYFKKLDYSTRGYYGREHIKAVQMAYLDSAAESNRGGVLPETDKAISEIAELCDENGCIVVFFKSPMAEWTKGDSKTVKEYMLGNHYKFIEMNDFIDEMGIDTQTDFYDEQHLCVEGAEKATDFIAEYLKENYSF